ncbi:odorant receptor 13a-like [Augochlora pura]
MFEKATPEKAVGFVRFFVSFNMYWPIESTATKFRRVFYNALKAASLLCTVGVFLPLSYSVYVNLLRDDAVNFSKAATMTLACVHVVGQAGVSFFQHDQLQRLVEEMMAYFRNLKPHEKEIYQRYIDNYCPFYAVSSIWNALAAFLVIVGALFTPQPFPMMAEYPFSVDYEPVRSVVYLQHSYVAVQCMSTLSSNMIAALLILFAAGRFEILMVDLRDAITVDHLKSCIEQCQLVRKYAEDVVEGVQYIAIITLIISSGNLVLSGFNVIGRQPIMVKVQSIFLAGSALIEVYMCAWPADALMEVSETAVDSVYRGNWYNQDLRVQKTVLLMLLPQKPIVISLKFVMVALSLNYYCSYVSNAFSLFTALRVVLDKEVDTEPSTNSTCCID